LKPSSHALLLHTPEALAADVLARVSKCPLAGTSWAGMGGRDFRTSRFLFITHDLSPFFPHHV
jgi:hypothetical protein